MRKRDIRNLAREYAAELLHAQDLPDWAPQRGVPEEDWPEFLRELDRIAGRIARTITQPTQEAEKPVQLPLMARRPGWPTNVVAAKYDHRNVLCLSDSLEDAIYRITDTDEHGLPVVVREPGMPEAAKYQWFLHGDWQFGQVIPFDGGVKVQRIEDYNEREADHG